MQSGKNFKIGVTVFLVTVCVLGLLGGLIAVNEVSYRLSEGERTAEVTEKSEDDVLSYLESIKDNPLYNQNISNNVNDEMPNDVIKVDLNPMSGFYPSFNEYHKYIYFKKNVC